MIMDSQDERTMFVGNLHDDVTEALLYELCFQAGPIQSIHRPKDKVTGKLKNFAFVVYNHAVSVPFAVHLISGIKLFGRALNTQRRNNLETPHYSLVGIHTIECERQLQRILDGKYDEHDDETATNGYNRSQYCRSKSTGSTNSGNSGVLHRISFRPAPLDPNQTWKNNIHYHEQMLEQQKALVSNVTMSPLMGMSPIFNGAAYNQDRHSNNAFSPYSGLHASSPALSASHYHAINSQILSTNLSSDLRNRLGNSSNYRSTRDNSGSYSNNSGTSGYSDQWYTGRDNRSHFGRNYKSFSGYNTPNSRESGSYRSYSGDRFQRDCNRQRDYRNSDDRSRDRNYSTRDRNSQREFY